MKIEFETLAEIAADTTLDDTDLVKNPADPTWQRTVGEVRAELRILEGRRHSAIDQAHLDAAGTHAAAVLDRLHSAGARVPGISQTTEADIEKAERAAESYPAPDAYAPGLAALRAASATTDWAFEDKWKTDRRAEYAAESRRREEHFTQKPTPRLTTAELKTYAPPDAYGDGIKALQARDAKETK